MKNNKKTTAETENPLGIPVWTGNDVAQMRTDYAPPGKTKLTYQEIAAMLGLKDRAGVQRYEKNFQDAPLPGMTSHALELVRRILSEKRDGKIYELVDALIGSSAKLEARILAGESDLTINLCRAETAEVLLTLRLKMANGLFLIVESPDQNEDDAPLQQIKLL